MKKVIVHVVEAWKGGIATYVASLIQKQLVNNSVFLILDKKLSSEDERCIDGCEYIYYDSSRRVFDILSVSKKIRQIINKLNPDVIHAHSTYPGIYTRLIKSDYKVIYSPHGWSFYKSDVSIVLRYIYTKVEYLLSNQCYRILCISQEEIELGCGIGIKPMKLKLVHTCLPDVNFNHYNKVELSSKIKIGFFGRLDFQKGFDVLLESAPLLNENIEVHVYGDNVRNDIKANFPANFIKHGWLENSKITEKMLDVDVVIVPSRWEGFALVPIEAMRAARPLIISPLSSLPEVVINSFNGLILSSLSTEAIVYTLNSLSLNNLKIMGVNARAVYEASFCESDFLNKIEKVYND